jgi:hypothetical protein
MKKRLEGGNMRKCPFDDQIDGYLAGRMTETENARFEEHYFNCPSCFENVRMKSELLDVISRRGAWIFASDVQAERRLSLWEKVGASLTPRQWVAAAAAAAVILAVVIGIAPHFKPRSPELVFTGDETVRGESLTPISPLGDLGAAPAAFEWNTSTRAAEYQVTLLSDGETLWTETVHENRAALPEAVKTKLVPGGIYTWQVKAYAVQGTLLAASPKVQFRITR